MRSNSIHRTGIPYLTHHWPIATGCLADKLCWAKCWARAIAHRFGRDFTPTFHPDLLADPLRMRGSGHVVGVAFGGDLFVEGITDAQITATFGVMTARPDLTFVLLTKRPSAAAELLTSSPFCCALEHAERHSEKAVMGSPQASPLPNAYLGFSAWDQESFDAGWRAMAPLEAAGWNVWCSLEPMIGAVDVADALGTWRCSCCGDAMPDGGGIGAWRWTGRVWEHKCPGSHPMAGHFEARNFGGGLSGIILGAESGPGARPLDLAWVRQVRDQCIAAGVPFAYKQGPGDRAHWSVLRDGVPIDGGKCGDGEQREVSWMGRPATLPVLDGTTWTQTPWGDR